MALRLKGKSIYDDNEIPDYDFLSPNNIEDAYDLVEILYKKGYKNLGTIKGIHVQTMRIKTDFNFVADISYMPKIIFDNIPTLDYNGLKIIHPHYQIMDIHLSFSFPYDSPPMETIFHRFQKDLIRYNKLIEMYPIPTIKFNTKFTQYPMKESILRFPKKHIVLSGFPAFFAIKEMLDALCDKCKVKKLILPQHKNNFNEFIFQNPTVVTQDPQKLFLTLEIREFRKHYPFMNIFPESYVVKDGDMNGLEVLNVKTNLLAIHHFKENIDIACNQQILLYFLFKYYYTNNEMYKKYYQMLLEMLDYGAKLVNSLIKQNSPDFILSTPFCISPMVYGEENYNAAYLVKLSQKVFQSKVNYNGKLPVFIFTQLPKNFHIQDDKYMRPDKFNYKTNTLYSLDYSVMN